MTRKSFNRMTAVIVCFLLFSCKKSSTDYIAPAPVTPVYKNKLVFVYRTDSSEGVAYKALMQNNGCGVTLIDEPALSAFNFASYQLIVVGNNTDSTVGVPHWSSSDSLAVSTAAKPMLLMGHGGFLLGNKLNFSVNWDNSAVGSTASMIVLNGAANVYKSPKTIIVPANSQLDLYNSTSGVVAVHFTFPNSAVELIGGLPAPSFTYTPVNFESNRIGSFGYYSNINNMTQTGKDFMVNLSYYVGKLTL